jgi:hypothetical protein
VTARTGSVTGITSSNQSFSQAVTVPDDATLAVLGIGFYQDGGALPTAVTLGGNSMSSVVSNTDADSEMTALYQLANPPTGSQTLAVTWASALEEGAHYFPAFYNDVDTSNPIRGTGNAGNGGSSETTGAITTAVGDIVVAVGASFGSTDCNLSATAGADQTEVADTDEFQTIQGAYGEKSGVSGTTTFTCAGAFVSISAASLRDAPAGGTVNTQTLTSNTTISDQALTGVVRNRLLGDDIVITEGGAIQSTVWNMLATDEITVIDELLRWARFNRLIQDDVVITDDVITSLIGHLIFTSVLSSNITVTDESLPWALFHRMLDSGALTTDQALAALNYTRELLDSIGLSDYGGTAVQRFILLTDTLSLDDSISSLVSTPTTYNPLIRIGFDQPRIEIGGYALA